MNFVEKPNRNIEISTNSNYCNYKVYMTFGWHYNYKKKHSRKKYEILYTGEKTEENKFLPRENIFGL